MSLNDLKRKFYLEAGIPAGGINDMEMKWLFQQGATSGTLSDRWMAYLAGQGQTNGTFNDRLYNHLGGLGYTGTINDRLKRYYENPATGDRMVTTLETSVTYRGVTYTFDKAMPVGYDVMGEPVVISIQEFDIISVTPTSAVVDGYIANGLMLNPFSNYASPEQGFDEALGQSGLGASQIPYNASLNITLPYTVASGTNAVFAKSVRRSGLGGNPIQWGLLEDIVALTVLESTPFDDIYRPGTAYFANSPSFDVDLDLVRDRDYNASALMNNPTPSSGTYSYANMEQYLDDIMHFPWNGWQGENLRRFYYDAAAPSNGYAGDYGGPRAHCLTMLHSDALNATQKKTLAQKVIRQGLEVYAAIQNGWQANLQFQPFDGAGQWHGYHPQLYTTAFLLNNSDILLSCQLLASNMQDNISWINSTDIGFAAEFPGPSGEQSRNRWTFMGNDLGKPHWNEKYRGSQRTARYFDISTPVGTSEMFAVILLQNGPGGVSGYEAFLNGGPHDTTNPRAAGVDLFDRWLTLCNVGVGGRQYRHVLNGETGLTNEFYTTEDWRGLAVPSQPKWTGLPETFDVSNGDISLATDQFTAAVTGGQIDYDVTNENLTLSTTPITQHYVRYSYDGIQFTEDTVAGKTGTITGLMHGAEYWCGFAVENAAGKGGYSVNFNVSDLVTEPNPNGRNKPTTNDDIPSAAQGASVGPVAHYNPYPDWVDDVGDPVEWYEEAPTTLTDDILVIYAGAGEVSGYPAPTIQNYEFTRVGTGVVQAAGPSPKYELTADDLGEQITYTFELDNASGTPTISGNTITVFPRPTYDPEVIIDTDGKKSFTLFWPEVNASLSVTNAILAYVPTKYSSGFSEDTTDYAIAAQKSASRPEIEMDLAATNPLTPGATYRVQIDCPMSYGNKPQSLDLDYRLNKADSSSSYYTGDADHATLSNPDPDVPTLAKIDRTFRVAADETDVDLWFWARIDEGTGGDTGGDIELSNILVEETIPAPTPLNYMAQKAWHHDGVRDTDASLDIPSGVRNGNTMLASMFLSSNVTVSTVPSGWTLVDSVLGTDWKWYLYSKQSDGTEGGTTVTWTTTGASESAFYFYELNLTSATITTSTEEAPDTSTFDPPELDFGSVGDSIMIPESWSVRTNTTVSAGPAGFEGFEANFTTPASNSSGEITGLTAFYEASFQTEDPLPFIVDAPGGIFSRLNDCIGVRGTYNGLSEPGDIYDGTELRYWFDGRTGINATGTDITSWDDTQSADILTAGAVAAQDGTGYAQFANNILDGMRGSPAINLSGLPLCDFWFRARHDGSDNFVLATNAGNGSPLLVMGESGSGNAPTTIGGSVYIDGVLCASRGAVYTAMNGAGWVTVEVRGATSTSYTNFSLCDYAGSSFNGPISVAQLAITETTLSGDATQKRTDMKAFLDSLSYT